MFLLFYINDFLFKKTAEIMTSTVDMKDESRGRPIQKAKVIVFLFSLMCCLDKWCLKNIQEKYLKLNVNFWWDIKNEKSIILQMIKRHANYMNLKDIEQVIETNICI